MGICLLVLAKQKKMIKQILRTAWKDFIAHFRPSSYTYPEIESFYLTDFNAIACGNCGESWEVIDRTIYKDVEHYCTSEGVYKEQRTGDEVV